MPETQKKIIIAILFVAILLLSVIAVILYLRTEKETNIVKKDPVPTAIPTPTPIPGETLMVTVHGFVPDTLEVKVGSFLNIANFSDTRITIQSDMQLTPTEAKVFNKGAMEANDVTDVIKLEKTGTYTFYNALKPSQIGKIVVR